MRERRLLARRWRLLISPDPASAGDGVVGHVFDVDARGADPLLTLTSDEGTGNIAVAWSPDGSKLAASTSLGNVRVWNAQTGVELFELVPPEGDVLPYLSVAAPLAFSPDSRLLATGTSSGTAILWDVLGRGQQVLTIDAGPGTVQSVAFSPDGTRLMTSTHDQPTKVWDITSLG